MEKILLVNKFYYPRGGDCIYMINLERELRKKGHEVAVFAMQHPDNRPSGWSEFFPSEVSFSSDRKTPFLRTMVRPLGSCEVVCKFNRLLDKFRPDIVHLNSIHSQLSPVLCRLAYKRGIRVIWTLHDYKLLCPRYDCLRKGKTICEKCFTSKTNVIKYRCIKENLPASILAYFEALKWNRGKLSPLVSGFICPSAFMNQKMSQGLFPKEKLITLNNFIDVRRLDAPKDVKSDYCCYVGRISYEKGIETMLTVFSKLPYKIKLLGGGPLLQSLKKKYTSSNIEFLGYKKWSEIKEIVGDALFTITPSEWYENNPISIIESLCLGTPALGANIGGIPELIDERRNGLLFESGNKNDLKEKIITLFEGKNVNWDYKSIAESARLRFSADLYYDNLIKIYRTCIND